MTKTITLTGEEIAVKLDKQYPYIWVQNLGDSDVYMSVKPGIVPEADGVNVVPAGGWKSTGDVGQTDTLYLLGSGKVEVTPQFDAFCPGFNPRQKGGDYTLPVASEETLGGVKSGRDISVSDSGGVTVNSVGGKTVKSNVPQNAKFTDTVYTLPTASTNILGGVKIDGSTISINSSGVISIIDSQVLKFGASINIPSMGSATIDIGSSNQCLLLITGAVSVLYFVSFAAESKIVPIVELSSITVARESDGRSIQINSSVPFVLDATIINFNIHE